MNRDTICVQGGYTPGNGEPRQVPIIQSTTFKYATSEDMGKLFDLEADGYFSPDLQNPTCDLVAKEDLRAGGRHRRHADVQRPGGQLLRAVQHLRGRRAISWRPAPSTVFSTRPIRTHWHISEEISWM